MIKSQNPSIAEIKIEMLKQNETNYTLAKKLNLSIPTISNAINGRRKDARNKIVNYLNNIKAS